VLAGPFVIIKACQNMSTDFEHSIVSPTLKVVAAHWLAARRGREMPPWASLMPSAIKLQLPNVWSYTYDFATNSFTGRLAGDRVAAIFGKNFHGLPMSEAHPKHDYSSLFAKCKRVLTEPALYHGTGIIFDVAGKFYTGERIIMPLSNADTGGEGVFGATDFPSFFPDQAPEINFDAENECWFRTAGERTAS
jgi:hypothetical protein